MNSAELLVLLREHQLLPQDPKDFIKSVAKAWSVHSDELLIRTILHLSRAGYRGMSSLELLVDIAKRNSEEIKKFPVLFNHGLLKTVGYQGSSTFEVGIRPSDLMHLLRFDEESLSSVLTFAELIDDAYLKKRGRRVTEQSCPTNYFSNNDPQRALIYFDALRSELFVKLAIELFEGQYDQQVMPAERYQELSHSDQILLKRFEFFRKLDTLLTPEHRDEDRCGVYIYLAEAFKEKKIDMAWLVKNSNVIKGFKAVSSDMLDLYRLPLFLKVNFDNPENLNKLFYLAHMLDIFHKDRPLCFLYDFFINHEYECSTVITDQMVRKFIQQSILGEFKRPTSITFAITKMLSEVAEIDPQLIESVHTVFLDSSFQSFEKSNWENRDYVNRIIKEFISDIQKNNVNADLSKPNIRREFIAQIVSLNIIFKGFAESMSFFERSRALVGAKDLATDMRVLGESLLNQLQFGQSKEFVEYTSKWALSMDLFAKNRNPLSLKQTSTATRIQQLLTAEASSSKKQDTKQFVPTESVSSSSCSSTSMTQPSAPPLEEEKRENQNSQFVSTSTAVVPVPPSDPVLNLPSPPVDEVEEDEELHLPSVPSFGGRKALTE